MKNLQAVNQYIANLAIWNIKLHNFHFNVVGSQFVPAHKYLEEVYDVAFDYYDAVAEHVKMQGEEPVVHVAKYLEIASLKEEPGNKFSVEQVYKFLVGDFELLNKEARAIRESIVVLTCYFRLTPPEGNIELITYTPLYVILS